MHDKILLRNDHDTGLANTSLHIVIELGDVYHRGSPFSTLGVMTAFLSAKGSFSSSSSDSGSGIVCKDIDGLDAADGRGGGTGLGGWLGPMLNCAMSDTGLVGGDICCWCFSVATRICQYYGSMEVSCNISLTPIKVSLLC